jgi:hypothetical protein
MCLSRDEVIREVLAMIHEEGECDIYYLSYLFSQKLGDKYYFTQDWTFFDLIECEKVFGYLDRHGDILKLTDKGERVVEASFSIAS